MRNCFLFACVLLISTIVGCATGSQLNFEDAKTSELVMANYDAADKLIQSSTQKLDKNAPIIVATIVDIDNLQRSSRLGRLISEQVGTRLTQLGYSVIELKLRGDIFVKRDQGELLLSREVNEISRAHKAQAVLVGSSAEASTHVYINVKIIGTEGNIVISAHNYALPLNANVKELARPTLNR